MELAMKICGRVLRSRLTWRIAAKISRSAVYCPI
jgi:hypothetical protein